MAEVAPATLLTTDWPRTDSCDLVMASLGLGKAWAWRVWGLTAALKWGLPHSMLAAVVQLSPWHLPVWSPAVVEVRGVHSESPGRLFMDLWILQNRPMAVVEPYELMRLREEARGLGLRAEAVTPDEIDLIVSRGGRRSIRRCGTEVDLPDILLPRTGSATDYFGLAIVRQLEHLGVVVVNSSRSIEAVKDKLFAHQILAQGNVPIPRTMLVRFPVDVELVASQIGFPCVVKLLSGSCGEGVLLSRDSGSFRDLMEFIAGVDRSQAVILQQYIGSCPGQDLRVWVIGGRVLGAMLRSSTDGSFKANISRGGDGQAYHLNPTIEHLALQCVSHLKLDVAGVDLLFEGDHYCVCEVNSAADFAGFEAATGINVARALLEHCLNRLHAQRFAPTPEPLQALFPPR